MAEAKIDVKIPSIGESISEVTVGQWLKKDGQVVKLDEPLCEVESDKATVELPSPAAGKLKILIKTGETVKIGTLVATIEAGALGVETESVANQASQKKMGTVITPVTTAPASPAAQKMIKENNLSSEIINSSGKDGRITKQDVLDTLKNKSSDMALPQVVAKLELITPPVQQFMDHQGIQVREVKRERMSSLRKTIAKRLLAAKNQTAMLTTFNEVDMDALMQLRKKYKDTFKEKHDVNLGFMSFFTKAVCLSLKRFPIVNSQIDGEEVVSFSTCDIGVAVSTPKGLVVPVLKNAQNCNLAQIEKGIGQLALKARDGKLTLEEMQGGTFTITNGGVFGSMLSTPILNPPQSAILGMHNIVDRPWVVNGQIVIRPIMYLALSYDHRLVDGKDSVGFLKSVKEFIEDPNRLLLDV